MVKSLTKYTTDPKDPNFLDQINNEPDAILQELREDLNKPEIEAQREADNRADFEDSSYGKKLLEEKRALENKLKKLEAAAGAKGLVLADGTPQNRMAKQPIDPSRLATQKNPETGVLEFVNPYKNWPVRVIDGKSVQLVSSRPFWDKAVGWDDSYRQTSEHFIQCEHPNYANAVYCRIPQFINFDKSVREAFVIRTDEEIQLFFVV